MAEARSMYGLSTAWPLEQVPLRTWQVKLSLWMHSTELRRPVDGILCGIHSQHTYQIFCYANPWTQDRIVIILHPTITCLSYKLHLFSSLSPPHISFPPSFAPHTHKHRLPPSSTLTCDIATLDLSNCCSTDCFCWCFSSSRWRLASAWYLHPRSK